MLGAKSGLGPQLPKGPGRGQSTVAEPLLPHTFVSSCPHVVFTPGSQAWIEVNADRRLAGGREARETCLGMEEEEEREREKHLLG